MKNIWRSLRIIESIVVAALLVSGCTTNWQQPPPSERSSLQRDPLSYGAVMATVKKGETTQEDIMRVFGAPNVTTMDGDGQEVWMYDRISNASEVNGWSEARRFTTFFGLETLSAKEGGSRASSTQTLTVIITFDTRKKVRDYSARATQF